MANAWLAALALLGALAPQTGMASRSASGGPIAKTAAGTLEGERNDGVDAFRGIPYAAPPVGPLRWHAPASATAWSGIRSAKVFGPACPQIPSTPTQLSFLRSFSEDCLSLNVWRPVTAHRLPVMVWIHGGGFIAGSGSEAQFDGAALARRGVIVVTFNYRLGRLGFFAHPALVREAGGAAQGNYGLLDQIAALRWVRRNIGSFGGDPAQVTIFGESAGGISVLALMSSPQARGLFGKAIVQSGAIFRADDNIANFERAGAEWGKVQGVAADDPDAAQKLRSLPLERIVPTAPPMDEIGSIMATSWPSAGGAALPVAPREVFRQGGQAKVPLIIGSNASEARIWLFADGIQTMPLVPADVDVLIGSAPNGNAIFDTLLSERAGNREEARLRFESEMFLGMGTREIADRHRSVAPTYLYRFDAVPAPGLAATNLAPHGTELFYVFGTLARFPFRPELVSVQDRELSNSMSAAWASFAKSGRPATRSGFNWPAYDGLREMAVFDTARIAITHVNAAAE